MNTRKRISFFFLILLLITLFFRTDYRFKNTIECCSDEYDYFMHASTIVLDFDFDYSNQELRNPYYEYEGKKSPTGFVGTGILVSPFLFIGNLLNKVLNNSYEMLFNYSMIIYSFASIFYFLSSFRFLNKILNELDFEIDTFILLLIFSGSGLSYYAFERFGMPHVFEVFATTLTIYFSLVFFKSGKNIAALAIPIFISIGILVKMTNYYLFVLPYLIKNLYLLKKGSTHKLLLNKYFILSTIMCVSFYTRISMALYGRFVINPQLVYKTDLNFQEIISYNNNIFELIFDLTETLMIVLFSNEFGLFWVSPILFFGLFFCLKYFLKIGSLSSIELKILLTLIVSFGMNFYIIHIWQTAASSYGYRYMLSLVPIAIALLPFASKKIIKYYLIPFSLFSNLSILFFETTKQTQLSTVPEVNTFGTINRFVEPNYVTGVLQSFFDLNSYLIIFSTSLLGALIFKFVLTVIDKDIFLTLLQDLGLPSQNEDFQILLTNLLEIKFSNFIFVLVLCIFISAYLIKLKIGTYKK